MPNAIKWWHVPNIMLRLNSQQLQPRVRRSVIPSWFKKMNVHCFRGDGVEICPSPAVTAAADGPARPALAQASSERFLAGALVTASCLGSKVSSCQKDPETW